MERAFPELCSQHHWGSDEPGFSHLFNGREHSFYRKSLTDRHGQHSHHPPSEEQGAGISQPAALSDMWESEQRWTEWRQSQRPTHKLPGVTAKVPEPSQARVGGLRSFCLLACRAQPTVAVPQAGHTKGGRRLAGIYTLNGIALCVCVSTAVKLDF